MKKLAFFLGIAIAIFVSAQIAQATQVIDDALQVNSLKVGQQGVGGVTYFNGTIINETTGENDVDNPVAFGDNVRIDGRVYRGAMAGTGDSLPFIVNDNAEVTGSLTTDSLGTGALTASTLTTTSLTSDTVTTTSLLTDSINLTTLDNLGCIDGEIAYYGTSGWECTPDYSASIISFIVCLNTVIAGDTSISVADWNTCYTQTF